MDPFNNLEDIFRRFPGIGPRQAKRFVYHLLSLEQSELLKINENLSSLKSTTVRCTVCQRFFFNRVESLPNDGAGVVCNICKDPNRDVSYLMIISKDIDLLSVEKSRSYNGMYFVLGNNIPILEENPTERIRQKELLERVNSLINQDKSAILKEVIIATSANPEGDNTADYLNNLLRGHINDDVKVTVLGRGLSTGSELEYSDSDTIKSALMNRKVVK
jgi:recombination protein RecR